MIPTWYTNYNEKVMTAGIFHYEQSIALQKYCNVALYYPNDNSIDKSFIKNDEKGLITYRSRFRKNKLLRYYFYYKHFKIIYQDFKPDILHAHVASSAGKLAVLLGKLYKIPVIITEHNPIELMGLQKKKNYKLNKFAYKNSKANICVSKDSMYRLKEYFPDSKFEVIYNGVINPNSIEKENKIYYKDGYVNFCIVAAFYSKNIKGYQYLLPAIKKLIDDDFKIILHICGGGEYLSYYKNLASELGIANYCIFYGSCSRKKVYTIISQMDFSVSASIFECSGVSVQEAMLLGKPLVVTKSGGANSLVNKTTAIIVDRNSTEALVKGIKKMISILGQFNENKIKEYAYNNFEIDNVSKQYMKVYKRVMRNSHE